MAILSLSNASLPALWRAVLSDGVTPSLALSITTSPQQHPLTGTAALRISGGSGALNHRVRTDAGGADLSAFEQLRILWQPSITAGPASGTPFWAEIRMGSVAMPVGAPGNDWHRLLPASAPARWECVSLSLDDLPGAVRGAVSDIQLICRDDSRMFNADLSAILAVSPELVADVDEALTAQLDQVLTLHGGLVPAEVQRAGFPASTTRPLIAILPYTLRHVRERSGPGEAWVDFVTDGYSVRPPPTPWDLYFAVEALADTRADQAALIDFVIQTMPPAGALLVAGQSVSIEAVDQPEPPSGGFDIGRQLLHYRVRGWRESVTAHPVRPVETVEVEADIQEMSHG